MDRDQRGVDDPRGHHETDGGSWSFAHWEEPRKSIIGSSCKGGLISMECMESGSERPYTYAELGGLLTENFRPEKLMMLLCRSLVLTG